MKWYEFESCILKGIVLSKSWVLVPKVKYFMSKMRTKSCSLQKLWHLKLNLSGRRRVIKWKTRSKYSKMKISIPPAGSVQPGGSNPQEGLQLALQSILRSGSTGRPQPTDKPAVRATAGESPWWRRAAQPTNQSGGTDKRRHRCMWLTQSNPHDQPQRSQTVGG